MKTLQRTLITLSLALLCTVAASCGDGGADSGPTYPAMATFGHEQGVDMATGEVFTGEGESPAGTFANSDLFAKENGGVLKLYTGGPTSAKNRPVEWFKSGGTPDVFTSLDDVPNTPIPTEDGLPLNAAETGNGFILIAKSGAPFKGFVVSAGAATVTVEYAPLD